jgi:predicted amidohydrolase YtcJ
VYADFVLANGLIYTGEGAGPGATALAVRGDRILAVGSDAQMRDLLSAGGEWLDLKGRCVTYGLVDAHVHFQWYSLGLQQVDLTGCTSLAEALSRVAEAAGEVQGPNQWLMGRGWSQGDWIEGRFPTAADLDAIVLERPALLRHKSGHAAWVNSRALRLAGIRTGTPDPPGGHIQRDSAGSPTGVLLEDAIDLVDAVVPAPGEHEIVAAMRLAQERCLRAGLTGIHDFDGRSCFGALQSLRADGDLKLRVVKNIPVTLLEHAIGTGIRTGFGDDWLRIGGVKIFADGALGPRTAAMIAPYEGEPTNRGIVVTDKKDVLAYASLASANQLSLTVHAIGDRANHDVLDVYQALREEEEKHARPAGTSVSSMPVWQRHRIEHAQILHPDDFARVARLNVIASMQPIHATSDMDMADRHWGARSGNSYAWRSMLRAGATLAFGSDAPVDPIEPLAGIYAAVTRRRPTSYPGPDGWYPEQRLSMTEAVQSFTIGPAIASGRERWMGRIEPGYLADLTIYSSDIFTLPPDELLSVEVDGTMVDGVLRYRSF